jgi:hypothetical protein
VLTRHGVGPVRSERKNLTSWVAVPRPSRAYVAHRVDVPPGTTSANVRCLVIPSIIRQHARRPLSADPNRQVSTDEVWMPKRAGSVSVPAPYLNVIHEHDESTVYTWCRICGTGIPVASDGRLREFCRWTCDLRYRLRTLGRRV